MNATISMDSLWGAIRTLSLRNKRWLADKLIADIEAAEFAKSKDEIMAGMVKGIKEAKEGNTFPIDTLWNQL